MPILAYSILLMRWFSLLPLLDDFLLQIRLFDFRLDTRRMLAGERLVCSIEKNLEGICMFGHHESAQATVLFAEDMSGGWEDIHHVKIEFVLEVHPPNGQKFKAKATHHFIKYTHYPRVGDVVNVKYHPKSLEVTLELKDDIRYGEKRLQHDEQARHQEAQARRDALLETPSEKPHKTKKQ